MYCIVTGGRDETLLPGHITKAKVLDESQMLGHITAAGTHHIGFRLITAAMTVHPQNVRFKNVRFQHVWHSKRPVSKRRKRQVYKTSALQKIRFTKCQVYKTSGLQNVQLQKKHPFIFCTCGWWKSADSVAAMFAGKVMAVFYSLF